MKRLDGKVYKIIVYDEFNNEILNICCDLAEFNKYETMFLRRKAIYKKRYEIKQRNKKLRKENICLHLRTNISSLMSYHIKKDKISINTIIEKILGYSIKELKKHLEKQFDKNMNWNNYGEVWHIDHIVPASWFSYKSFYDEGFYKCWSLNNLQPKLKKENISKGNRYADKLGALLLPFSKTTK